MMSSVLIYLDESGDPGWSFSKPYRAGGSSRFLTIAALIISPDNRHLPKRIIKTLYRKHRWKKNKEKKWSAMNATERLDFSRYAKDLEKKYQDIKYFSITVKKENVGKHIREDGNLLYNYMIRLMLVQEMKRYDSVTLLPDQKSIKLKSGNSLHDYLQTFLWLEEKSATKLNTRPGDSSKNLNIQFSDMLSGIVQSFYEDSQTGPMKILQSSIQTKTLFFR